MEDLKARYVGLKPIKGFSRGTIKTKLVWCVLLGITEQDDFDWLVNTGVLRSKKLNKIIG